MQKRVARGLLWTLIDTWGGQLLGLIIFAILAHLLEPVDFGLVALAAIFVALGQLLSDQGLGDAVIQRRELTRRQLDTAFWAALATGIALSIAGFLLSGPIAALLHEPRLEQILQVLSLVFVFAALNSIQMALLRRELNFRSLAMRRLAAVAVGGVVGIVLAVWFHAGAWALVGQQMASSAMSVVMLWAASPWRPSFSFSAPDFRSLFAFGLNVLASDFLGFLSRNMDNLLVGVFLGPEQLGFYAVAYRILDTSQTLLVSASRRLVFPSFARLQHDLDRVSRAYLRLARSSSALILPGYIGLALVAHEAIVVLFGQKWAPSAAAASLLFLIGPVLTVQAFSGAVWNAVGHPEVTLRFRLVSTITNVVGFVIAVLVFKTIVAVAAAFVIRGYLFLPLNLYWMRVYAGVSVRDQLLRLKGVGAATALMVVAVLGVKFVLLGNVHAAILLAAELAVGVAAFGLGLWLVERSLLKELFMVGLQVVPGGERLAARAGVKLAKSSPAPTVAAAIEPPVGDEFEE
jgi:O-antigen/teichoic acid export membrane protein